MDTGIKRVCSSFTMAGSAKVDSRSITPLFHVHPSGCPSIAQIKIGFPSRAAAACASRTEVFHGMVRHVALRLGCNSRCSFSNSASVNPRAACAKKRRMYPTIFMCHIFECGEATGKLIYDKKWRSGIYNSWASGRFDFTRHFFFTGVNTARGTSAIEVGV